MARETIFQFNNRRLRAGEVYGPLVAPPDKLAGRTNLYLTLTIDDPTADPPTDASVSGYVEASTDNGVTWDTVAYLWGGTSGVIVGTVAISGRLLRAQGEATLTCRAGLLVEVE
jgi:hypothetical protein